MKEPLIGRRQAFALAAPWLVNFLSGCGWRTWSEQPAGTASASTIPTGLAVAREASLDAVIEVDAEAGKIPLPRHYDPGLGALGLIFDKKPDQSRYPRYTPRNCQTFASTGGEGVHFSVLLLNGKVEKDSPVVVTMPAAGGMSVIVGENLHDFLCLGYYRGYFALEQLAYKTDLTLEVYMNPEWKPSEARHQSVGYILAKEKQPILDLLVARFGLRPWTDRVKFHRLQKEYLPMLEEPKE